MTARKHITTAALAAVFLLTAQSALGWKFLVYGDSRGPSWSHQVNTNILSEIAHATTNEAPDFVLIPGDFVWAASPDAFIEWKQAMAPVYNAGISVYPVMGNHEINNVAAFTNAFGADIPDNGPAAEINRTYAISHKNVLILALDSYVNMHRVNQKWIRSILSTNTLPHVFATAHEPAFKVSHLDTLDDYPDDRDAFWRTLSFGNATAYFCGHDHFYDHSRVDDGDGNPENDIHQYIVGTAGAPLYGDGPYDGANGPWQPQRVRHENQYGYVVVEIEDMSVTLIWKHRVAPGVYEEAEAHARTVKRQRPILNLKKENDSVHLSVTRLTPGTFNTLYSRDKLDEKWIPVHTFTAVSNSYEKVIATPSDHHFYCIKSR